MLNQSSRNTMELREHFSTTMVTTRNMTRNEEEEVVEMHHMDPMAMIREMREMKVMRKNITPKILGFHGFIKTSKFQTFL